MNSNKNTNNNTFISIGTESQYSQTSENQAGGGIITNWLLGINCSEYVTELILDSFNRGYSVMGLYIIDHALKKKIQLDFSTNLTFDTFSL